MKLSFWPIGGGVGGERRREDGCKVVQHLQRDEDHGMVGVQHHEQHDGHEHGCGDQTATPGYRICEKCGEEATKRWWNSQQRTALGPLVPRASRLGRLGGGGRLDWRRRSTFGHRCR